MKHEVKQLARFHPQQGIWQADEPLFYNGVELADEDATLLEYNIAGSRVSNGKWCLPWVLEIWEHREPQILTFSDFSGDFMGFPNGFLVVVVKP